MRLEIREGCDERGRLGVKNIQMALEVMGMDVLT